MQAGIKNIRAHTSILTTMKKIGIIIPFLCLLTFLAGCGGKSNSNNEAEYYSGEHGYEDGTYCAEIEYYYFETGTNSTYTLGVEIENNELTLIHWPNGGWLDASHFSPPDISGGEASFTSDRGVDYTVRIIGKEGDCSLDTYVIDEDDLIRQKEEQEEEESLRQEEEEEDERLRQEEEEETRRQEEEEEERRRQEEEENDSDNE